MTLQLRRCFGTIHEGHCHPGWDVPNLFIFLSSHLPRDRYTAGAFAFEETKQGNLHIQFYVEMRVPTRTSTMMNDFLVTTEAVFDRVVDATGSWQYCTGTGPHVDKPAFDRFDFGTPKLYGGTAKADLKDLVDLVIDGNSLGDIMRGNPYSYCVHRARLIAFFEDWHRRNP